jgi:hypothetical protein
VRVVAAGVHLPRVLALVLPLHRLLRHTRFASREVTCRSIDQVPPTYEGTNGDESRGGVKASPF